MSRVGRKGRVHIRSVKALNERNRLQGFFFPNDNYYRTK